MNPVLLTRHTTHYELLLQATKVNVLNESLIGAIDQALTEIESDPLPVLVYSEHRDFVLGADITAFAQWFAEPADQVKNRIAATQRVFDRFARLPSASVAWVRGFALGGGFELALACDYRIADQSAQVGLPEVTLGLCPSWGGTVRSAALMGYKNACDFVLSGRPLKQPAAMGAGLLDELVEDKQQAVAFLLQASDPQRGLHHPQRAHEALESVKPEPGLQAQSQIVQLMQDIQGLSLESAQEAEVDVFVALAQGHESAALVQRFLNDQACKREVKQIAASQLNISRVGVLGAGIMGGGIAWQCALCGFEVVVRDITEQALATAQAEIDRLAKAAVKKGKLDQAGVDAIHARLALSLQLDALADCDLIIEAVTEQAHIKKAVLSEADQACGHNALLTSNTSTLSITELSTAASDAARFAGLHFFNPVPVMPLVEVIKGADTSAQTVAQLVAMAGRLGKRAVVVNDCPGFLVNRVLFPYLNAFDALAAQGHDIAHIDQVMKAYGWPMGPGVLSDVIGIDTCVHASDVMAQGFPDRMPPPQPSALRERLSVGALGQKTQAGLYQFEADARGRLMPTRLSETYASGQTTLSDKEIIETLMRPMVQELALCVDEGVVASAAVADMACLLGLGFPAWRGGPLYWGQQQGWVKGYY